MSGFKDVHLLVHSLIKGILQYYNLGRILPWSRHRNVWTVRTLLKWSMWHQWFDCNFTMLQEYFVCAKKKNILYSTISSLQGQSSAIIDACALRSYVCKQGESHECSLSAAPCVCVDNGGGLSRKRWNCWILLLFFVFFAHTKYSRNFIKWWFNHWCHMDHFNYVLTTFLCLDHGGTLAVYWRQRTLRFQTSEFVFWRCMKVLRVWNDMRVSNSFFKHFYFWVN